MNFDMIIPRKNTNSMKWDSLQTVFGDENILPLWVADMDFPVAKPISDAIQSRSSHPLFGYGIQPETMYEALIGWFQRRHGWTIQRNWILTAPGVVPSMSLAVQALTEPGDGIIVQTPVYPPFFSCVNDNGRQLVNNPLISTRGYYEIDFDLLSRQVCQPHTKLLLLCSPHNPVGRVWSRKELERLAQLCEKNDVLVVSDEIHCDLVLGQQIHVPYACLGPSAQQNSIVCISPSKTFNIAGLNTSFLVVPNELVRRKLRLALERLHVTRLNVFGAIATETAYAKGDEWLDDLLVYLTNNALHIADYVEKEMPSVNYALPEGTYLGWLDFRKHFFASRELKQFLIQKAKVGLNDGLSFGEQGEGFARINFGCPRAMLTEGLQRISKALR